MRLSYIIGIDKEIKYINDIKEINYDTLLNNLSKLKKERHQSFADIANNINCSRSICHRYFNGLTILPIDRLVPLAKFYNMYIDTICGKV